MSDSLVLSVFMRLRGDSSVIAESIVMPHDHYKSVRPQLPSAPG